MSIDKHSIETSLEKIHNRDCVEGMNNLPTGSVDLVFADPPFNIGYKYDVYDDRRAAEDYLSWSKDWIQAVWRVLKDDGAFWLAIGDDFAAELKVAAQQIGFHTRSWVIWYYTFGVNCKNKFTRSHTHLFYFVRDVETFTFLSDDPANRIPSARQLVYNDRRANSKGRLPDDTWIIPPDVEQTFILRPQDLQNQFQPDEDTWYFPRVAGTFKERAGFHGCQMPEQLLGRIVRCCSRPDEIVLDPFAGSASTLVVARKLGRRVIGFELSKEYAKAGQERLRGTAVGDALVGSPEPTMSAKATPGRTTPGPAVAREIPRPVQDIPPLQQQPLDRRMKALLDEVIASAFLATHRGYAVDRMLTDPELQAAFHKQCSRHGLPLSQRDAVLHLMKLRKRGGALKGTKRYSVSGEECEPYLFASEIAWRRIHDQHPKDSIEEILASPTLAQQFDEIAEQFAPGYSSLDYRWAALRLRKSLKVARLAGRKLRAPRKRWLQTKFAKFKAEDVADRPGVYFVLCDDRCIFVGAAACLRTRLTQITTNPTAAWGAKCRSLSVQYFITPDGTASLLAWVSCVVSKMKSIPEFNIPELVDC